MRPEEPRKRSGSLKPRGFLEGSKQEESNRGADMFRVPALLLILCVTWDKLFNLFKPQFTYL